MTLLCGLEAAPSVCYLKQSHPSLLTALRARKRNVGCCRPLEFGMLVIQHNWSKKLTNTASISFPMSPCIVLVGEQAQVSSAYFSSWVEPYSISLVPSIGLFRGEGDYLWLKEPVVLFWDWSWGSDPRTRWGQIIHDKVVSWLGFSGLETTGVPLASCFLHYAPTSSKTQPLTHSLNPQYFSNIFPIT